MDVDTPQQQPPPVSPPAQALQNTTEELKVLQKTYADLVQLSGEDSAAATHMKKMLESHSNKLTPVAVAKNHKSLLDQLVAWEKSKSEKERQHQSISESKKAELDTLRSIVDAKEKELISLEQDHSAEMKQM
eukprot:7003024-Karenia_brevis.AAC.1